jgi:hypothetical protein
VLCVSTNLLFTQRQRFASVMRFFELRRTIVLLTAISLASGFNLPGFRAPTQLSTKFIGSQICQKCITHCRNYPRNSLRKQGLTSLRSNVDAFAILSPTFQALSGALSSFSGVAVLAFVIAFHETGHFLAARVQVVYMLILPAI